MLIGKGGALVRQRDAQSKVVENGRMKPSGGLVKIRGQLRNPLADSSQPLPEDGRRIRRPGSQQAQIDAHNGQLLAEDIVQLPAQTLALGLLRQNQPRGQLPQLLLVLPQGRLGCLEFGDVHHGASEVSQLAAVVARGASVQGHPDRAPILPVNLTLESAHRAALLDQAKELLPLRGKNMQALAFLRRGQEFFRRGVAHHARQGRVGRHDPSLAK